ncbi:MAG: S9 family peptidase [Terriglobales bacterium]|jgi:dipeptidyl aminopeptidase/acylaminoacyl peptidase
MRRFPFLFVMLFFLSSLFSSLPAFSQTKRPFTFEDLMKLKRVGEPVPSPDGKWVLFAAVDVDLAANKKTSHIWIVPLAGGPERVLITDQDGDRPRWAPDAKRFAFISNKDSSSQVWIADFDGSAGTVTGVHELTHIATEADGELWSPDGKNILFTSDVYPECDGAPAGEPECNEKKRKEVEDSKVKAIIFDHLLYRHWNAYKRGTRSHLFVTEAPPLVPPTAVAGLTTRRYIDLTPGDYDAPVFSLGGQDNYSFSPDGQEVCYTSNHDKVEATSTNNDLWIVPVSVGAGDSPAQVLAQTKNITAGNPASDSTPLYSPDGKYIAYRAQQRPGYESDRFRLMLYDRKTGEKKNLTESFDKWVGTYAWAPDSSRVYFAAEDKGTSPVYSISFGTEIIGDKSSNITAHQTNVKIDELIPGFNDDLAVSPDGKTLWFTQMSLENPTRILRQELWVLKSGTMAPHDIHALCGTDKPCSVSEGYGELYADPNRPLLSQVAMSPIEPFWFTGAFGDKVEGFLVKPPNLDASRKYPLKFIIHGGPESPMGDMWSYRWNAELFAASGYVVIMINFHGSPGYGQKFIDEINGDWGGAPFEDLMKGLDYAEKTYPFIDKDRECALGASYGGYMANWALGHTDRFKCIVSHDGMFNTASAWGTTEELWFNNWEFKGTPYTNPEMYEKWSPRNSAKNFKTPTLVIHGQLDYRLDVSEGFQLFDTLQVMGVPSKMLYFPDEGHWVLKPQNSQLWYKTVNDWVDRWTGTGTGTKTGTGGAAK